MTTRVCNWCTTEDYPGQGVNGFCSPECRDAADESETWLEMEDAE